MSGDDFSGIELHRVSGSNNSWYVGGLHEDLKQKDHLHNLHNAEFRRLGENGPLRVKLPGGEMNHNGYMISETQMLMEAIAQAKLDAHNVQDGEYDMRLIASKGGREYVLPACFATDISGAQLEFSESGAKKLQAYGLSRPVLDAFIQSPPQGSKSWVGKQGAVVQQLGGRTQG